MTDYMDLALKYGGFTSLDKVYLKNTLSDLSDSQKNWPSLRRHQA